MNASKPFFYSKKVSAHLSINTLLLLIAFTLMSMAIPIYSQQVVVVEIDGKTAYVFDSSRIDILNNDDNVFIGNSAGLSNTPSPFFNVTTGKQNTFLGSYAGRQNTVGSGNTYLGSASGAVNATGISNTFVGWEAGPLDSNSSFNTFLGAQAGWLHRQGNSNVFVGSSSGFSDSMGVENTFIGCQTGASNRTGKGNTFVGFDAGVGIENTNYGVFLGYGAGASAGRSNALYIQNAYGDSTQALIYGEFDNKVIRLNGELQIHDMYSFPATGSPNGKILKMNAGALTWSDDAVNDADANPSNELQLLGTISDTLFLSGGNNVKIPPTTSIEDYNMDTRVEVGDGVGDDTIRFISNNIEVAKLDDKTLHLTSGMRNVMIGKNAGSLSSNTMDNTIIGHSAGKALLDGSHNTFLGAGAGEGTTTGANNTYLGSGAGRYLLTDSNNVHIGYDAGTGCITGSKNVLIGSRAGVDACGSNNIFIGYQAGENFSTSNSLIIQNSSSGIPLIYGEFDNQLVAVNGKLAVGHENPTHTVHVLDSTTAGGDGVGHFEFTGNGLVDAYGVSGRSVPADFFGYGGNFDGGYTGVRGRVLATGGSTYYGARGEVYGAVGGQSYGVYGSASGAGLVYAVYANGDMAYTGALINASDANLKTNVDIVPHGLEAVMQLLPRSYEYKSHEFDQLELPDGTHYGFLAQELEMIVPDLVKSSAIPTNHDKADADTQEFMKGVNYVELIPILTKAIQDQQVIIESLKQRISALEGQ